VHLHGEDRNRALALIGGLDVAEALVRKGERDSAVIVETAAEAMAARSVTPEYIAIVDPDTLEPIATVDRTALVAVAARVGPVRLIDNVIVEPR
jgi:pantoate--beta-alanine ligase